MFFSKARHRWLVVAVLLVMSLIGALLVSGAAVPIPQTRVQSVTDNTVTGIGWDFPAGATFNIRMAAFGTRGAGGEIVGTATADADGDLTFTVEIPAALRGHSRIAIRLDGFQNYYSFAWFNFAPRQESAAEPQGNEAESEGQAESATPLNIYTGFPTIGIASVQSVEQVGVLNINVRNLPPNQMFTVRINSMFTQGIGGVEAATFATGEGGDVTVQVPIPDQFRSASQAAVRIESSAGYYAYNWFHMGAAYIAPVGGSGVATGGSSEQGGQTESSGPAVGTPNVGGAVVAPPAVYPTLAPIAVSPGKEVTMSVFNLPKNMEFTVVMGEYGTQGLRGFRATTFNSGDGGDQVMTFRIPAEMSGVGRIAVRIQGIENPFFAYAWFWN